MISNERNLVLSVPQGLILFHPITHNMNITDKGIAAIKIISNDQPSLISLKSGIAGHFFAGYQFYIKEFNDEGEELKVYPISPFKLSSFSLIMNDLSNSTLICASISLNSNEHVPSISSVVVFNTNLMAQLFHISFFPNEEIMDVFCSENGRASYILITTLTNRLYCFDVETRANIFTLTFPFPILKAILETVTGKLYVQTVNLLFTFTFPSISLEE